MATPAEPFAKRFGTAFESQKRSNGVSAADGVEGGTPLTGETPPALGLDPLRLESTPHIEVFRAVRLTRHRVGFLHDDPLRRLPGGDPAASSTCHGT